MPSSDIILLAGLPVLLIASGFFSGTETALFSLTKHQSRQLERRDTLTAAAIRNLLSDQRALLITLLLGNMVVNVSYFITTTLLMLHHAEAGHLTGLTMPVASAAALVTLILCGEVLPKMVASHYPVAWARGSATALWLGHRAIVPVRMVLATVIISPLARLIAPIETPPALSAEELGVLLQMSQQRGAIDHHEEAILQQTLDLCELRVSHIMQPRVNMVCYDLERSPGELTARIRETRYSHIPICRGDLDHIEGIVAARRVLLHAPRTSDDVAAIVEPVTFVPELQRVDQLLTELRKRGAAMAIVVDEYGGTAGLVTIEDVVGRMVGAIAGPSTSDAAPNVVALSPGRWRISGGLAVYDWAQAFGGPQNVPGITTVGGLVMARLGRPARIGDRTQVGNISITVESLDGRRIETLQVEVASQEASS